MYKILLFVSVYSCILLSGQCIMSAGDKCTGVKKKSGTCLLLTNCQPIMTKINKAGSPMPRYMRKKLKKLACGFQGDQPLICCVNSGVEAYDGRIVFETDIHRYKITQNNKQANTTACTDGPSHYSPQSNYDEIQNHKNFYLLPSDCGFTESTRIIGGESTRLFELPWMALLSYDSDRGKKLLCGGTLISERYVLTAAHCVSFLRKGLKLKRVLLGEHDVRIDPDCETLEKNTYCAPRVRTMLIEEVIVHSGYDPQRRCDDIALIRLAEPADFSLENMSPICLPFTPELQKQDLVGVQASVAGWGATETGLRSPVLLNMDLTVSSNKDCFNAYKGRVQLSDGQLCAGGVAGKDTCRGDSGGPLIYPSIAGKLGLRYVQYGVVSFGTKRCGLDGYPGVYTRVGNYMEWILDKMRP